VYPHGCGLCSAGIAGISDSGQAKKTASATNCNKALENISPAKEGVTFCFICAFLANYFLGKQTESERKS
jgi:hypothetical protein